MQGNSYKPTCSWSLLLLESNVICVSYCCWLQLTQPKKEICLEMKFLCFWNGYSHYVMLQMVSLNSLRDKLYWVLSCINRNESTLCVHVLLYVDGLTFTRQTIVGFLVAVDIHKDMMTRVWKKNKIKQNIALTLITICALV